MSLRFVDTVSRNSFAKSLAPLYAGERALREVEGAKLREVALSGGFADPAGCRKRWIMQAHVGWAFARGQKVEWIKVDTDRQRLVACAVAHDPAALRRLLFDRKHAGRFRLEPAAVQATGLECAKLVAVGDTSVSPLDVAVGAGQVESFRFLIGFCEAAPTPTTMAFAIVGDDESLVRDVWNRLDAAVKDAWLGQFALTAAAFGKMSIWKWLSAMATKPDQVDVIAIGALSFDWPELMLEIGWEPAAAEAGAATYLVQCWGSQPRLRGIAWPARPGSWTAAARSTLNEGLKRRHPPLPTAMVAITNVNSENEIDEQVVAAVEKLVHDNGLPDPVWAVKLREAWGNSSPMNRCKPQARLRHQVMHARVARLLPTFGLVWDD
jgi:hypothetical protein